MLHENGFELEEEVKSEKILRTGPVIELFGEFEARARTLYSKTVSTNSSQNNEDKPNILDLQEKRLERLNSIMSGEE